MKKLALLITIVLSFAQVTFAQQTGSVRGTLQDILTKRAIEKATVSIVGTDFNTLSDEGGKFSFTNVPVGRLELSISSVGYTKQLVKELILQSNKELVLALYLETATNDLDEVMVTAASPNLSGAMTSLHAITVEQVMRLPATFFDPARMAFTFPGVANTNDQANEMSIRGNNPRGLQWRLEGMEIVNPNHLANAGTFSDQATVNSGGTNMISAQMMGDMNFLTGAFPAEYGNALSGVMDMRLREGNNKEYEHTAQVGLIGIDLASEGPLSKKKGSSYLINYRYSFTGLLALGGLTFGGESIKFQDLAVNLSFPNKKFGDVTIFGMGGANSNEFAFEDEEGTGPEFEKDLNTIDYYGKMGAAGITHTKRFNPNLLWKNAVVYSGLRNERTQGIYDPLSSYYTPPLTDVSESSKLSLSSIFTRRLTSGGSLKSGFYVTKTNDEAVSLQNGIDNQFSSWIVQPFAQWSKTFATNGNVSLGLHYLNYTFNNTNSLEPRASIGIDLNKGNSLNLAYGLHSQLLSPFVYSQNANLKPTLSNHFVLSETAKLSNSATFKTEIYYQGISNALSAANGGSTSYFSGLNMNDLIFPFELAQGGKGRNYGIELSYQKYLDNGFFALINTTLYKSEFMAGDGKYYQSKYSGNHILNVTLGKEWDITKDRVIGANVRVVWMGGFRNYGINLGASQSLQRTVFDYSKELTERLPDYFRPDLRVYLKRSKEKHNRMWSIDIQNVANYQNVAFDYFDDFQDKIIRKYQLGMIPMLNYRWEF